LEPRGSETRSCGPFAASPRMSWAEPPPRSTTSAGVSHEKFCPSAETAPRKPRRASSSPEIKRTSRPAFSSTSSTSARPFFASRTALVASTAGCGAPFRAASRAKSLMASAANGMRAFSMLPVSSTPAPRRAETFSPVTGRTAPFSTSPTSRCIVFEPTSMTACGLTRTSSVSPSVLSYNRPSRLRDALCGRDLYNSKSYNPCLAHGI
jgi:hypothetical protein